MSDYNRLRTPFIGMSFAPDIPSNALGINEYNNGSNVECDVRGIRKVSGEQEILSAIPGNVVFMDGGFRSETVWVYIAATREGKWYMLTAGGITNITPGVGANPSVALTGYSDDVNITTSWVGNVFFINDSPLFNINEFVPVFWEVIRLPVFFCVHYSVVAPSVVSAALSASPVPIFFTRPMRATKSTPLSEKAT